MKFHYSIQHHKRDNHMLDAMVRDDIEFVLKHYFSLDKSRVPAREWEKIMLKWTFRLRRKVNYYGLIEKMLEEDIRRLIN